MQDDSEMRRTDIQKQNKNNQQAENTLYSRKHFLRMSACALCAVGAEMLFSSCGNIDALFSSTDDAFSVRARHWMPLAEQAVRCMLCPNECLIADGSRGKCAARENKGGALYSLVYSRIVSAHVDPIEKKPFNHFLPGSRAFSIATTGCGLSCRFCQNWQISQSRPEDISADRITKEELVRRARQSSSVVIAYTYNEPTVQFEYLIDSARYARSQHLRTAIISSGYINAAPLKELLPHLSAVKIDLKSFREEFYRTICGGTLAPVKRNLELVRASGAWLEIVVLIIPTLNDAVHEIREMARWVRANLGAHTPVHFTRFYPMYLLTNVPPTPVSTLERCREIAVSEGLRYVYVGNVPGHRFENTYCHACGALVIRRTSIFSVENRLVSGACPSCRTMIPGVWS